MRHGYRSDADHERLCDLKTEETPYSCPRCKQLNCLCTGADDTPICDVCWNELDSGGWTPGDMRGAWPW